MTTHRHYSYVTPLGKIDGLHGIAAHRLSTCVLVNHLEGAPMPAQGECYVRPPLFITKAVLNAGLEVSFHLNVG